MSALPLSARFALWATVALHGRVGDDLAVAAAHADVDHVAGRPAGQVALWRDVGETAVLVALPRPGNVTGLPTTGPAASGAAAVSEECVFVPAAGGLLVPVFSTFGPSGDEGIAVEWQAYDSEPVPRHRLEALSLRELDRTLSDAVRAGSAALESVDGRPWSAGPREAAERRLAGAAAARTWGVPDGTSAKALRLMLLAARVGVIAEEGLRLAATPSLDVHSSGRREAGLRALSSAADEVLAGATNVAVMGLAGWRPAS